MRAQEKGIKKNDLTVILSYDHLPVIHWENRKRQLVIPLNESNLSPKGWFGIRKKI